jgi:hypothetical protein
MNVAVFLPVEEEFVLSSQNFVCGGESRCLSAVASIKPGNAFVVAQ